jgi:hypothetical protein
MTISYKAPVKGKKLLNLPMKDIEEMASIVYKTRARELVGKILTNNTIEYDDYVERLDRQRQSSVFLLRAYDGDKCVGFLSVLAVRNLRVVKTEDAREKLKMKPLLKWWEDEGLIIDEGYAYGTFAVHDDYRGRGIINTLRMNGMKEAKKMGFKWHTSSGMGPDNKKFFDYVTSFFMKNGLEDKLVKSDIPYLAGFGKFYYMKL